MQKDTYKNAFLLSTTFLGAVIGAGFASGKEISQFFIPFEKYGFLAIFLSCFAMSFYFYAVLKKVYSENITGTFEYLTKISNSFFAKLLYGFIYIFTFAVFCAMFAGSGALLEQRYNIPFSVGTFLMGIICYLVFYKNAYGILKLNAYLTPVMILGILLMGIFVLFFDNAVFNNFGVNIVKNSLVYASYNAINIIVVYCEMGHVIKNKKTIAVSSIASGTALFIISSVIYILLMMFKNDVIFYELPMLEISKKFADIYTVILIFAMVTTAVSAGFGLITFLEKIFKYKRIKKILPALMCVSGILFAQIGFSEMVAKVYSLFGYLGIFLFIIITIDYFKQIKCLKKRDNIKKTEKKSVF